MLSLVPKTSQQMQATKEKLKQSEQVGKQRLQLARLLRVTEEMLMCAQDQDWDAVEAMEASRHQELKACFENSNADEDEDIIKEALATLLYLNAQIAEIVKNAREEAMAKCKNMKVGQTAVNSYQTNQT